MEINVNLAGIPLAIEIKHKEYLSEFEPFLTTESPLTRISLDESELKFMLQTYPEPPSPEYLEYSELCRRTSDALLRFGRAVFHGLSFFWRDRAWLVTAPSGTGKTTHYLQWKRQFPDELTIMNGDKPIIAVENGKISVHPSPWYGKEGMHRNTSADLAGIILLKQSDSNTMRRLTIREATAPLYAQFLFSAQNAEQVTGVSAIETAMLESVPVWLLSNKGDLESAALCRETLKGAIE